MKFSSAPIPNPRETDLSEICDEADEGTDDSILISRDVHLIEVCRKSGN